MYLSFLVIELVCISLGAGASFIFDSFFLLSPIHHKIKTFELKMLRRLSLMSIIGGAGALFFYIASLALEFDVTSDIRISVTFSKIIILMLALLTAVALRKIHLSALVRHQEGYGHLSEHLISHPDPFVSTAAFSTVSWMLVIFLTALEYRQADSAFHFGFLAISITYIVLGFFATKAALFIKKRLIRG
jgi:hypothetical protein